MSTDRVSKPKATLDMSSRQLKALNVKGLLNLHSFAQPIKLPEIGCNTCGIAHYSAAHPDLNCQVVVKDAIDSQHAHDSYEYNQAGDVELPLEPQSFDVIVINHAIENMGEAPAQLHHPHEIHRPLKHSVTDCLATPNRWMLHEPHFRRKLLSWWPRSWLSLYLRLMDKEELYDCKTLNMRELENVLSSTELNFTNLCIKAWRAAFDLKRTDRLAIRMLSLIPDSWFKPLTPVISHVIYQTWQAKP